MSNRFTNNVTPLNAANLNQLEDDMKAYVDANLGAGVSNHEKDVTLYGVSATNPPSVYSSQWNNLGTIKVKYTKLGNHIVGAFAYWTGTTRNSDYWFRLSLSEIGTPFSATATVHDNGISYTKANLVTWCYDGYIYVGVDSHSANGIYVTFYC